MAFPKKGTRTICVGKADYLWRIGASPDSGFSVVLIQLKGVSGSLLRVKFPSDISEIWLDFSEGRDALASKNYRAATPKMVSSFIEQAIQLGWACEQSGNKMDFTADENDRLYRH